MPQFSNVYIASTELEDITSSIAVATASDTAVVDDKFTENKYLELAEDFKNIMEEKDQELSMYKRKLENYKYIFCKVYGNISMIDDIFTQMDCETHLFSVLKYTIEYVINELQRILEIEL